MDTASTIDIEEEEDDVIPEEESEETPEGRKSYKTDNPLEGYTGKEIRSPLKAVREWCEGCSQSLSELHQCVVKSCPLYAFRLGYNPYSKREKRILTDEQKQMYAERGRKLQELLRASKQTEAKVPEVSAKKLRV
jgi:hypothetical protein